MQSKGESPPRGLGQLWGFDERGRRGPEARYTATDVAVAAVAVADRAGLDAVTLASVAAQLGLTTTALYRYVDTKDVLVDLIVDTAIGPPPTLTAPTWEERAVAWAQALAARYRQHPWLAQVVSSGVPRRPGLYSWLATMVAAMSGEPAVDAMRLALLLDAVVRGFATVGADASPPPPWLIAAIADRFPELGDQLGRNWADADAELDHALAVIVRGVAPR